MIYRRGEVGVVEGADARDGGSGGHRGHENSLDHVRSDRAIRSGGTDGSKGAIGGDGQKADTAHRQMPVTGHNRERTSGGMGEGSQCIWLARVRPEDCEGIVKHTILKGKVVKPERQLRGGFDRQRGLVSW